MSTLCALADIQAYTGDTSTGTATIYSALIPKVSAAIETWCARTFEQNTYTELRNGNNGNVMMPVNRPCTSVTSVVVDGVTIPQAPDNISFGWVLDPVSSLIYIRIGYKLTPPPASQFGGLPTVFNRGVQNVVLKYTAGFATIPPDVNQAACEWIAYKTAKRTRLDKRNEVMAQQTLGFDLSGMPDTVKELLIPYRVTGMPQ